MSKTQLLDGLVVAIFASGLLAVGAGMVLDRPVGLRTGLTLWWVAFGTVVIENYLSRRPVQTRGGIVRKEDGAIRYALPYIFLAVAIVISGIMLLAAWVAP